MFKILEANYTKSNYNLFAVKCDGDVVQPLTLCLSCLRLFHPHQSMMVFLSVSHIYRTQVLRTLLGLDRPAGPDDKTAFRSALNVPSNFGRILDGDTDSTFPILLDAPIAIGLNTEKSFMAEFANLFV
jgi:hypothetical protein